MKLKLLILIFALQAAWILGTTFQQERSRFLVNFGVAFIALDIFATYIRLIGSMARTGTMFLISGVFLIAFSIYLEKKRRKLMQQIKTQTTGVKI